MGNRPSVLIVDDHESIRDPLSVYIRKFDFDVEAVANGNAMRKRLEESSFDLILLDIMLPGENGLSLCKFISEHVKIPVILLTAISEQADRIAGLEIGADDYIVKPFDPRELVARIRSVLRRGHKQTTVTGITHSLNGKVRRFEFGGWSLDTGTRELRSPQNEKVQISTPEFHLLKALVEHANRVLSRNQLLELTHRTNSALFDRSIDSQISRLRKKLEPDPRHPSLLKTVRGDGYLLAASVNLVAA